MVDSDTESVVGDPTEAEEAGIMDDMETEPQRGFTFGDTVWIPVG